jgi:O-antigen/teichoic acid export membrane protein
MTLQESAAESPMLRFGRYALVGGEKALRIPVGILVAGLTSRALGVEDFGLFSSVLVLLTVMSPLASFGLESLGIALASKSHGAAAYIRSIASFRLLTGIVAAVSFLLVATAYFHAAAGRIAAYALCALSAVLVLRIYEIGENLLFAQERLATLAAVRVGAFLTANLLIVAVLLTKPALSVLLALGAAEAALLLAAHAFLFRASIRDALRLRGERHELASAFAQCRATAPVFLSGLLVLVLLNADKLLVYRFMGRTEVGLYNSAAKLVDVLYFIPMVIGTTHAASFARLAQGGDLMPAYRSALSTATWLSVAAAAVLALCSGILMRVVFGEPFAGAARSLALLAPCLVAVTWVSMRTRALAAMDQRHEILRLTATACVIHLPFLAFALWVGSIEAVALCQTAGWMVAAAVVPLFSPLAGDLSPLRALRNQ